MAEHHLDALFITDPGNLFYFTGYPFSAERSFPRPAVFILPLEDQPVLVAHDFHFPFPWRGDLTTYEQIGALPVELVRDLCVERRCAEGRIGAELGTEQHLAISHGDFTALVKKLLKATFVDAGNVLWQLRMVKTDAEVENITEACQLHDTIFAKCFSQLETGMTTRDVDRLFQFAALEVGGRGSGAIVCIGAFDSRQAAGSSDPDRVLKVGDMCWVDFSLGWHGYRTDYCRAVVAGGPAPTQVSTWAKVNQVLEAGKKAAHPGRAISEICRAELNKADSLGLDMSTWMARRYGHSSGIHTTEPPSVSLNDDTTLEPNMVIHLEPGVIGDDGIYVREEMILITESDSIFLSNAPWELGTV